MKREFLKKLGVKDEDVDKIMDEHSKGVEKFKTDAGKVEGLNKQITALNKTVKERDGQIEIIKKSSGDNEALNAQITCQ